MLRPAAMPDQLWVDGTAVPITSGQTVAATLWAAGRRSWRSTRQEGSPRGIFCGIGACFDCLVTIDARPDRRACLVVAEPGMVVTTRPAPAAPAASAAPRRPVRPRAGERYDVAVVGGGPGGLAAAASAARAGCRVALVDAAPVLGGQFWRRRHGAGPGPAPPASQAVPPHHHWALFDELRSTVEQHVDHLAGTAAWFVEPGFGGESGLTVEPGFTVHTDAGPVRAACLVLATGAHDRALPFPGWDIPGVVTPGAAQALLTGSGVPVGREVVVAGAGPFLVPVALGLAQAGARVVGVYDAGDLRGYAHRLGALAGALARLGEAARYAAALARRRIPYHMRHAVVAAYGSERVSGVDIARLDARGQAVPGSTVRRSCDAVAVGYGFTANLELALALGCAVRIGADGGLAVVVDDQGETSVPGVYAAGEVTGVGGALLAVAEGELAGCAAAQACGAPAPLSHRAIAAVTRRRDRLRAFAETMHLAHPVPSGWSTWLREQTLVCRCEEVPYGQLVRAVTELGARDARAVKLFARPGMGWCQGRICGDAVASLTATLCQRAVTVTDLEALARRPFAVPVLLGDLAALARPDPGEPAARG